MLARGTQSVYVCLRCQRNLVGDNLNHPARVLRRWQSAAPSRATLDEIDYGADSNSTPVQQPQDEGLSQPRPRGKRQFWRKWKPDPTAELGVDSLGKPAEVILLPSRDRRITQVPTADRTERAGTTLQESIDSENVPLSGAKLAENIEQLRLSVGKMRGQLEKHEWKTLKRNLKTGFQTSQLKKYIRLRKGDRGPSPGLQRNQSKDDIIRYLAEEIWGFITPARDETPTVPDKTARKVKFSFNLDEQAKLEHLLTHPTQPLKRIAEEHDVQIDVYPSQSRIRTLGYKHEANRALQKLVRYAKDLALVVIPLRGPLGLLYRDRTEEDYADTYLKSLRRKYQGLTIARDKDHITLIHLNNPRAADQARREILLSAPLKDDTQQSTVWPDVDELTTSLQPVPPRAGLPVMLHQYQWLRLVSSGVTSQTVGSSSFRRILGSLRDALNPTATLGKAGSRQELHCDLTAKFGEALIQGIPPHVDVENKTTVGSEGDLEAGNEPEQAGFRGTKSPEGDCAKGSDPSDFEIKKSTLRNMKPSTEAPSPIQPMAGSAKKEEASAPSTPPESYGRRLFVGGAPFLPQHLARMDPWPEQSSGDLDASARAILRLELCPSSTADSHESPRFEIFVTAGEAIDGKRSVLSIARISAVHQDDHFTVSCPRNDVDVAFTLQLKQDLAYPGSVDTGVSQPLMKAFRSYIGHAQSTGSSDWVFLPFVNLPIHHTLRNAHEHVQHAAAKKSKTARQKRRTSAQGDVKLEYLLRTVDVVDVDSRTLPIRPPGAPTENTKRVQSRSSAARFCLDHITYTGADATRQELRLAQSPVLHPPTLSPLQPHLPSFVGAALSLAERLSGNPLKPGYPARQVLEFEPLQDDLEVERLEERKATKPGKEAHPEDNAKAKKQKALKKGQQSKSKSKLKPRMNTRSSKNNIPQTKPTAEAAPQTKGSSD
ncbi:hypothetical protein A1O7_00651 [Cladophialophora yegresii CBS 114405]|uniref:Uncharacterized protein n=1 Tax=Cladophialophora yegresii CBS 114405 TaxID=1182544 RepID=W9WH44_9EURO|nr:uncharacterized protein A1O7_00651 [Cladophialophora yegresii CBS 114405]EXJ64315.1 hypothetical protein A1O7_00651 [Cladophialophora yegresii CBS 114405]